MCTTTFARVADRSSLDNTRRVAVKFPTRSSCPLLLSSLPLNPFSLRGPHPCTVNFNVSMCRHRVPSTVDIFLPGEVWFRCFPTCRLLDRDRRMDGGLFVSTRGGQKGVNMFVLRNSLNALVNSRIALQSPTTSAPEFETRLRTYKRMSCLVCEKREIEDVSACFAGSSATQRMFASQFVSEPENFKERAHSISPKNFQTSASPILGIGLETTLGTACVRN